MKAIAIIVAGGSGKRLGGEVPKQFQLLRGLPVLMHTITIFARIKDFEQIRIVLPGSYLTLWDQLCKIYNFGITHQIITGGSERYFSVKNAIHNISEDCLIAIHDGVRPLVSDEMIIRGLHLAAEYGAAIPVIPIDSSIRQIHNKTSVPVKRENYRMVQTPQVFKSAILCESYDQHFQTCFTDDASVVEAAGYQVRLFDGEYTNIKITTPNDLVIANALLENRYNSLDGDL